MLAFCCAVARCDDGFMPIADVKNMTADEADRGSPVRIRGVVTWHWQPQRLHLIVQDESDGIWINVTQAFESGLWQGTAENLAAIEVGSEVEIDGVVDRGGFAPIVLPRQIRAVGRKPLPAPKPIDDVRLFSGCDNGLRIVVVGVVQGVEPVDEVGIPCLLLTMVRPAGRLLAIVPAAVWQGPPESLIDATVQLTCIGGSAVNTRGQFLYPRLLAVGSDCLKVVSPVPSSPFESPRIELDTLAQFSPEPRGAHRVRTEGTVTHAVPGQFFYVQEGMTGVRVTTRSEEVLRPGDRVEIAGFVDRSRDFAGLSEAVVRVISHGSTPDPRRLAPNEIIEISRQSMRKGRMASPGDFDGCVIRFPARLLEIERATEDSLLVLACEGTNVVARIPHDQLSRLPPLAAGAELDITGIVQIALTRPVASGSGRHTLSDAGTIERLALLVRSADDVQVLKAAPWWTTRRLFVALATSAAVLLGSLAWVGMLQRQVAMQSRRLASEMQKRRDAAVEFEASVRERNRLAANLHDTLLQSLAGAGFQLDTCRRAVARQDLGETSDHLDVARRMLKHAVGELRGSVWALRTMPMAGPSFSAAVAALVAHLGSGHAAKITVSSDGEPFEIPNFVAGNLLLVAQEAIRNAVHHGQPKTIHLQIDYDAAAREVTITVADDGHGFVVGDEVGPAQGHFGVQGMQERIASLGGTLTIDSRPGQGTRVTAVVVTPAYDTQLEGAQSDA
ncbi:MAG: sensor histidine kinase [Planctomycetia bacterium]|nr:sensor histidine kinase [Planctomycetia bacterium]